MFIDHNKGYTKWSWEIESRNHKAFTDTISSEQISDKHKEMLPEIVTLSEICEHKDMSNWRSLRDSPLVGPKAPPTPTPPAWFTEITTVLSVACTLTSVIFTIFNTRFAPAAAQVQMMRNELSDAREAFLRLTCDRLGREISLRNINDRLDNIEERLGIFYNR
ncbi:hypothetical protein VN97_g12064 [Penicillium thymicola]|uniref:Uncharacterized protein n=1 Tax=Penicillium thymicola TaxID=293382 RepID=A0AAI9T712_PENTH|nr:hypothetical protein VN97_g12064 [Penicillium thymicola]